MKDTFHTEFLFYLEKDVHIKDKKRREQLADYVETKLAEFIRRYLDARFTSVYEFTERLYYDDMRKNVFTNASAKAENFAEDGMCTTALKYMAGFYSAGGAERRKRKKNRKEKRDDLQPAEDESLTEGKIRQVSLTVHERNRKYRQICLAEHGYVCAVCHMNFEKVYGEIGREFIEVHHLERIADTNGEHEIDPKKDLVPLCSNCHSMIHRSKDGKPFTLDELKDRYKGPKWNEE